MLYAKSRDCTGKQLLPDAERQNHLRLKRIITDLRRRARHHSSLIGSARASLHSDMPHGYETWLWLFLSEEARITRNLGPYTTLILIPISACMSPLYNRVCTQFWRVWNTAWNILFVMTHLLMLNKIVLLFVLHLTVNDPFCFGR